MSFLIGTTGLWLLLAAASIIAVSRPKAMRWSLLPFRKLLVLALCFHAFHVLEEGYFGFHKAFPKLLGLAPWSLDLFLGFNFFFIVVWLNGLRFRSLGRVYAALYLFLALASALNGLAHPALALAVGDYFPGLLTAPLVGMMGFIIFIHLMRATHGSPVEREPKG